MRGEYKEFRSLLRKSIGPYRTQAEFAAEADISAEHLNRMINSKDIARPTKKTLSKIAGHAYGGISFNELLLSCGYDLGEKEDAAMSAEQLSRQVCDVLDFIESASRGCIGTKYPSIDWLVILIAALHPGAQINFNINKIADLNSEKYDKGAAIELSWELSKNVIAQAECVFYFCETKNGDVVFLNVSFDEKDICAVDPDSPLTFEPREDGRCWVIKEKVTVPIKDFNPQNITAQDFIQMILTKGPERITTIEGYGFYLDKTPEFLFKRFLKAHEDSFCQTEKEREIFKSYVHGDKARHEAFEDYELNGWIDAVAAIITRETGIRMEGWSDEEGLYDFNNKPSVMLARAMPWRLNMVENNLSEESFMMLIDPYARELMSEVGECYFAMTIEEF